MAALQHGAAFTLSALGHRRFMPGKLNTITSVLPFSTSSPTKRTGRKNHLRQKILKTLKKPIIPKLPPANPTLPVDSPPQELEDHGTTSEIQESEHSEAGIQEVKKSEELREIEGSVSADLGVDLLAKNPILKYGLWSVGALVFQTVCAVWFFGSADTGNKSEIVNESDKSRVKLVLNGIREMGLKSSVVNSITYVDELEMERKIEEIRTMAREARVKESLESNRKGVDSEEIDGGKYVRSGIEEEVDNRLVKLRKKFRNTRFKMPVASVGHLRKESERNGAGKGGLAERESNGALLFKKKYKFKDLSVDPLEKPKGFGLDDTRIDIGNGDRGAIGLRDGENQTEVSDVDSKGVKEKDNKKGMSIPKEPTRNSRKKLEIERGASKQEKRESVAKPKVVDGPALEKNYGGSALEPVKSRKSNAGAGSVVSNKLSKGNDTSRGKGFGDSKPAIRSRSADFWWLDLPYVLAIILRRGDGGEGGEGLYTLRSSSNTDDQTSHMVAFEDQADATNFCYLLQSFFEDLELDDVKADVVPLSIKELKEALKLFDERALVVKRGQLKLYAGQPLTDAEVALRDMIEHG